MSGCGFRDVSRREFMRSATGFGIAGMTANVGVWSAAASNRSDYRLLETIDCSQDFSPERFFSNEPTQVVQSSIGSYREVEAKPSARFGYRFNIDKIGKPHAVVIRFPDDKRRFTCIMDGMTYDLTTSAFTDWAQPLSGKMLEIRQIFWPRWKDCSIIFMTWGEGEPAAVAQIEIWELGDRLPALDIPGDAQGGSYRELGIQYEDPCGTGVAEGAANHEEWIERIVEYARHSGQGLLIYPLAWYHGPLFPAKHEPSGAMDGVAMPDRKLYLRWTTQPVDWYARLLERFERERLAFQGALTLMRLGSLMAQMNTDGEKIEAGVDTIDNISWKGIVQGSTGDWTPLYNVRNFARVAELLKTKEIIEPYGGALPEYEYGENPKQSSQMGPIFNPLHPTVQKAILDFVGDIGERYSKYASFRGISFNMFASCMPWFGSIHFGYDDLTVDRFQRETGIAVPGDARHPDRFSKRYEYLCYVCRPAWVSWRCRKIRELFGRIHQTLASFRTDLRVTVTLWDETTVPGTLGSISASHQINARPSMRDLYRDGGIDVDLYGNEPGLEIDVGMGNSRDRGGHGRYNTSGVNAPLEACSMYRDFDFLDSEMLDSIRAHDRPGAFIFNCWVEAWGKHVWFQPESDDKNIPTVSIMDGKKADGILRVNSEYPKDGFWWDSQSRIVPGFPAGDHFMEPYAHAVAELDACRITRGGLFLDRAHTEALQRFARAYRALPRQKFATVGKSSDPVALRTLVMNDRRYFYLINRDYYPIAVEVTFNQKPQSLRDLADDSSLPVSERWPIELGPYELRSFVVTMDTDILSFVVTPSPDIVDQLNKEARQVIDAMARTRKLNFFVPGMDRMEIELRAALESRRYAWLRRAINSYIGRKCREIAAKSAGK